MRYMSVLKTIKQNIYSIVPNSYNVSCLVFFVKQWESFEYSFLTATAIKIVPLEINSYPHRYLIDMNPYSKTNCTGQL